MASYIKSDLEFILEQILIAERHAAGEPLVTLVPNTEVSFGLRTVDGSFNQLIPDQTEFGAADNTFPRLLEPDFRNEGDDAPFAGVINNDYGQSASVVDAELFPEVALGDAPARRDAPAASTGGTP